MKSLIWKINRMRVMSPGELGVRLGRETLNVLDHALHSVGLLQPAALRGGGVRGAAEGIELGGRFFFDPGDELLRSRLAPSAAACIAEADEILSHRVRILGETYDLGKAIEWQRDYRLGRNCPARYWRLINLKDPETEESIRWVWYFNRHKHLGVLGRAYFLTGNEEYAREIVSELCSWIKGNPPYVGVNWAASLEIALRLLSWLWAIVPIAGFGGLTPAVRDVILRSAGLQMRHLFRNLSTYSSANNHLISQALALLAVGTMFGNTPDARKWKETGLSVLWREILAQTHPDGVSKEQSLHYHCFVTELYAMALLLAGRNDVAVPCEVTERFGRMCDFVFGVRDSSGVMPALGDSDDQTVLFPEEEEGLFKSLMACASHLVGEEKFTRALGAGPVSVPLEAAFVLGGEGYVKLCERLEALSAGPAKGEAKSSRVFSEGGYYVLTDETGDLESCCVFDCGELGMEKIAAHGHADCLSITMTVNGREVLVDPGTFTYHSRPEWRQYFRSTRAHNTVVVDGRSQSEMMGPFLWKTRAVPTVEDLALESCFDLVSGSHSGYGRLPDAVAHRRVVIFVKPALVIIVDLLSAGGWHEYEQNFHFGGRALLSHDGDSVRVATEDPACESLFFSPSIRREKSELLCGQERPILGWRSERFWRKTPCDCLSLRGRFRGSVILESCLLSRRIAEKKSEGRERSPVSFSSVPPGERLYSMVTRRTAHFDETSLVNFSKGQAGEGRLEADASYVCMREFSDSGDVEFFGRNVGRVVRNGELLFESEVRPKYVRCRIEKDSVRFDARGGAVTLIRASEQAGLVTSLPSVRCEREGEFMKVTADT
ncbi:MAG: alginate lyase family protein [Candidatus Eisenbacteria bacterium]